MNFKHGTYTAFQMQAIYDQSKRQNADIADHLENARAVCRYLRGEVERLEEELENVADVAFELAMGEDL